MLRGSEGQGEGHWEWSALFIRVFIKLLEFSISQN